MVTEGNCNVVEVTGSESKYSCEPRDLKLRVFTLPPTNPPSYTRKMVNGGNPEIFAVLILFTGYLLERNIRKLWTNPGVEYSTLTFWRLLDSKFSFEDMKLFVTKIPAPVFSNSLLL
jgi:hypothetical protein